MSFFLEKWFEANSLSLQMQEALLNDIKITLFSNSPYSQLIERYSFFVFLPYKQVNGHWSISSNWTIKFQNKIKLIVKMIISNDNKPNPINKKEMHLFVKNINNSSKGIYCLDIDGTSTLIFRGYLDAKPIKNYIKTEVQEIFKEICLKFWTFFFKFCLNSHIDSLQHLKDKYQPCLRLRAMKEQFELARQRRQKSSKYNLTDLSIKVINLITSIAGFDNKRKSLLQSGQIEKKVAAQIYEKNQIKVMGNLKNDRFPFVQSIEIQVVHKQQVFTQGAYGRLIRGEYYYKPHITINDNVEEQQKKISQNNEENEQEQKNAQLCSKYLQKLTKKILVKKVPKQFDSESYEVEKQMIIDLRGGRSSKIGQYFLPTHNSQQKKYIYLELYSQNMYERNITSNHQFKDSLLLVKELAEGILFLWDNGIIHRDLKQPNIMIDSKGKPKIIDFGSATKKHISKSLPNSSIKSTKLMSTKGYYFPYANVTNQYILKCYTQDQYNQHQYFDVYSFGRILQNLFKLSQFHQDCIFHKELFYLSSKCLETNPADRLSPKEVVGYLYEIISLLQPGKSKLIQ